MDHTSLNQIRDTIIEELGASEFADKIEIVQKNAAGDLSLLPSIMNEIMASGASILVPIATQPAQAAKNAAEGADIQIVFSAVSNPIQAGLVESFDKTDSNITGVSNTIAVADIFKLAGELTPEVETFGLVYNASETNSLASINTAKEYCQNNGIPFVEATIASTADLQQAALSLVGRADAFFTPNDNTVASAMEVYATIAIEHKMPLYVGADSMVIDGGFATVGIDYVQLGQQTTDMIVRLLSGQTIAENPVEAVSEFSKMVNPATAELLGITIPEDFDGKLLGK